MISTPFARPLYVMAKPAGSSCNLACDYCYYLEKKHICGQRGTGVMSDDMLNRFVHEYITSQTMPQVVFSWHGGEPLMRPVSFYRRAMELQQRYGHGRLIENTIQTNGTLLTDEWCEFFRDNKWLVGVSVDGPADHHDRFRRNRLGASSHYKVMKGIELLNRYGVEWNALATVNSHNAAEPERFYDFFRSIGTRFLQFTPIVERHVGSRQARRLASPADDPGEAVYAPFSVGADAWGEFLCRIFDRWVVRDVGTFFVQIFDATLANMMGENPGVCTMARTCGHAGVIEHNGDVYSCDHFVFPSYKLGNLHTHTLVEMMYSPEQERFGRAKRESLPRQCLRCEHLQLCNGECPKNRFGISADGEPGLNVLCRGYHRFFTHSAPAFARMKELADQGRAPAEIMRELAPAAI